MPDPQAYDHWRRHGGVFDLSARAKLRLRGEDRVRYLNGQVTANVTKLGPGVAMPACVTSAKGKFSAEVFLSASESELYLDAVPELRESLAPRLERYIVADDVRLEDVTTQYGLLHFAGPEAAGAEFVSQFDPGVVRRARRFGPLGWDILLELSQFSEIAPFDEILLTFLHTGDWRLVPPELAESIRIEAGLPRWGAELNEDTLPPEAGLDRTHIDYAKGCYIGQEVISRLKSVGHVNRQLSGFVSTSGEPLETGSPIFAAGAPEKAIGELTSAAWSFALAKPVALGYLRRGSPTGELLTGPLGRTAITAAELPLAVHFPSP